LNRRIEVLQTSALPLGYRALLQEGWTLQEKNGRASAEMQSVRRWAHSQFVDGARRLEDRPESSSVSDLTSAVGNRRGQVSDLPIGAPRRKNMSKRPMP
jgi:hypothetical protein